MIGGLGVSGDGVDQDDFVTSGGAHGFEPPADHPRRPILHPQRPPPLLANSRAIPNSSGP